MNPVKFLRQLLQHPYWHLLTILVLSGLGFACLFLLRNPVRLAMGEVNLIAFGFIGIWRWSWFSLQVLRGRIYQHLVFPGWRRRAQQIPIDQLLPMCFLVPTYHEKPWITEKVFRAIAEEAKTLSQPITLLVNSGSDEENAAIRAILKSVDPELRSIRLIQMVQTGEGKRKAMADGLRTLAALGLPPDTIVALMDGDSELTPGILVNCLPFFQMFPQMGALTTDELPLVEGSYWFSEWFHLRMAQRNYHMCSVSLGQKVTCLTGRFSLFRSQAAFDPGFAAQLENDTLNDWLWGQFKFLSGDDKSTWYWLLKQGYDMIYVPDMVVYSIETISGSLYERAYQNMRRWYGNMLRNSSRAIALGPQKTGWFMWLVLVDQRISIWTPLFTPGLFLIALLQGRLLGASLIAAWVLMSRPLMLMLFFVNFRQRQSHLKAVHIPLLLASQWSACLVKIWTQMNLAQQKWANRGNQSISATGTGWARVTKVSTSRFLYLSSLFTFGLLLFALVGVINPVQSLSILWWQSGVVSRTPPVVIEAIDHGIRGNDGQDDAPALQSLLDHLPAKGEMQINLPIGEISLFKPVIIRRSNVHIQGQGIDRTIVQAHFQPSTPVAIVTAQPPSPLKRKGANGSGRLQNIHFEGFTLRQIDAFSQQPSRSLLSGIALNHVSHALVSKLRFERSIQQGVVLHQTQDVVTEYLAIDRLSP